MSKITDIITAIANIGPNVIETLSNKTLTAPVLNDPSVSNLTGSVSGITGSVNGITGSANGLTLSSGYTEQVFALTGTTPAMSPVDGSIQTWSLTGASTPTVGTWADGQAITLLIDDGTTDSVTWTSMSIVWKTNAGTAPSLQTTGVTVIALWKVGGVMYGARVGDA